MTLADDLKPLISSIRGIPGQFGLRVHSVALVLASTSGTYTGDGTRTETVTALTETGGYPPKVRWLKDDEVALGQLPAGSVEIGPITPAFTSGGTALASVTGSATTRGQSYIIRITGPQHPSGADYSIHSTTLDRALHYMIRAYPVGTQA